MSLLHTNEEVVDIVMNTPGLGYFEGASIVCIELNLIGDESFANIIEYVKSKSLYFERFDNLVFFSSNLDRFYILHILRYIQSSLKE